MSDCHLVISNTRLDSMFVIQGMVIQFVCMLLMPTMPLIFWVTCSWLCLGTILKQMIHISNLLKFFLLHLARTDLLDLTDVSFSCQFGATSGIKVKYPLACIKPPLHQRFKRGEWFLCHTPWKKSNPNFFFKI